jgi:hypothetical protein
MSKLLKVLGMCALVVLGIGVAVVVLILLALRTGPSYGDYLALSKPGYAISQEKAVELFGSPSSVVAITYQDKTFTWGSLSIRFVGPLARIGPGTLMQWVGKIDNSTPSAKVSKYVSEYIAEAKAARASRTSGEIGQPGLEYEAIAKSISQADDYGRGRLKADYRDHPLKGIGWVTSIEAIEDEGLRVMITVKVSGTKPEVIADVPKDKVQGVQLAAGQKVDYFGSITDIVSEATVMIHIGGADVTPVKNPPLQPTNIPPEVQRLKELERAAREQSLHR